MSAQPQYTPDQIKQAARNAYTKGDYAGAKRLDGLYQRSVQQQPQPQAQPQAKDEAFEGFGDAFIRGIDQPLENMGVTAEALGYQGVADNLKGAVDERPGQSASAQFMNADQDGSFAWRYLPKAGVEQAGQFAGSILSRLGGMGLGGLAGSIIPGAGTAGGAMVGGLTGPVVFEAAQQLGPIALERAKNNGRKVPNSEDWKYATGTSAGMGALNAIAPGLSGTLKRMLVEGATEGTQSVVEQVGSTVNTKKGLEVDPRQALAEGIIGGTSAGMVDTSVGTVKAAANLVTGGSSKSDMTEEESKAAASYAQRLIKKAEANDYDLKDIDTSSDKGARKAVDSTHVDMSVSLRQLFDDLKPILDIKDTDSLDSVSEKVLAKVAYRKANNKTKNTVEQEDFAAVEKLAGNTQEGRRAINLMHELNQMTTIHNGGYKGGVSQYTDQLAPLGLGGEGYDRGKAISERLLRPLVTAQAFASTGGSSLLGQLGAMGTGRAIDKVTGRRSTVDRFARKYGNQQGQPAATGTSVREENIADIVEQERLAAEEAARKEQLAAEQRDANLARVDAGAPPQFGSPEDIMRDGTGLDRAEIAQVLRILKANPNTLPAVRRAIDAYEQGIAVGGEMDFSLIRDINAFVDANPNYVQRIRQPNIQRAAATAQAGAQQNLSQRDQNYQRGIENNRSFVNALKEQLNADKSVRPVEKAKLLDTLNSMEYDLGADPVSALEAQAKRLYEGGVAQDAVQKYFAPYVDRVVTQQQEAQKKRQLDSRDAQVVNESQAAMDDSREPQLVGETVEQRKQRAEEQGYDTGTVYYHGTASGFSEFSKDKLGDGTGARSARQAFFFSDSARTAQSYAHNSAVRLPVLKVLREADAAERKGDFDKYDSLLGDAEALENRLDGDRRNGQNIVPVYLPNDDSLRIKNMRGRSFDDFGVSDEISEELKSAKSDGLKGVKFLNLNDSAGLADDPSTHVAIFEPSNIRSVNAQFDPAKTESSNLSDARDPSLPTQPQAPILTQDERDIDYTDISKFTRPTVSAVKQQLPKAEALVDGIINIGKKGTKYEDGIGTEEDLLALADHVDIAVKIYDDAEKYYADTNDTKRNTAGRHRGERFSSEIWVQGKELRGELPAFITLAHEISHGLEHRAEDPMQSELYERKHSHKGANKDAYGQYYAKSLRHKIADAVYAGGLYQGLSSRDKKDFSDKNIPSDMLTINGEDAAKIKNEIEKIQRLEVSIPSRPELGSENLRSTPDTMVRKTLRKQLINSGQPDREITPEEIRQGKDFYKKEIDKTLRQYRKYIRGDAEFAVDPVILYLVDPKTMKKVAPTAAKFIRDHFDKATIPIKFHAHPMAAILAILMAGALGRGEEEEEEQMSPGALSPQPALLSA